MTAHGQTPLAMPQGVRLIVLMHAVIVPLSFPLSGNDAGAVYLSDLLGVPTVLLALLGLMRPGGLMRIGALIFLGAVGASLVQLVFEPSFMTLTLKWIRLVFVFAPLVLVLSYKTDTALLRRFFLLVMVGGLAAICIGMLGFFYQWSFTINQTMSFGTGSLIGRAGGLTRDSSAFGGLVAVWTVLSATGLTLTNRWSLRIAGSTVIVAVTAMALYASLSRSAAVHLFVTLSLAVCLLAWRNGFRAWLWIGAFAAVCAVVSIAPIQVPYGVLTTVQDRFLGDITGILGGTGSADTSGAGRLESWPVLLAYFADNPVFGLGYKSASVIYGISPDNIYLGILTETGVVGSFGFLLFITSLVTAIATSRCNGDQKSMLGFIWVGFLVHGAFVDVISLFSSSTLVLTVTGLILQQHDVAIAQPRMPRAPRREHGHWGRYGRAAGLE